MIYGICIIVSLVSLFHSPDGLAVYGNRVYVCCEGNGTVMSFDSAYTERVEVEDLKWPEGICVTSSGDILVTEDAPSGRILMISGGEVSVLASGLGCPEGVTADSEGNIWFTTGGFQGGEFFTSLWTITGGQPERIYSLPSIFSFSDLEVASDGTVYICSETSGAAETVSVFSYSPATGVFDSFVTGIPACEGICLTGGSFPMYLVSEMGTVFTADSAGNTSVFIQGLGSIEDAVLFHNKLLVSEDSSGSVLWFDLNGR